MSSINTISSAIPRLCGSAAIYGGRSTGRAARKRASTSWVRSVDAFVRLARRARMAPIGRAVQFLCSPFDWSGSGKPVRASAAVTVLPRPEPRLSTSIERSNVSTRAPRFIRFGHGAPASPIVQYLHRGALRTAEKISRRSEDQIIPIIDPPDQYAAASLAQAYLSDNDYRPPSRCAGDARRSPLGSRVCSTCTHADDERQRSVVS